MTTASTRIEVNCETGEVKEIPLTPEEIAELQALAQQAQEEETARLAAEAAQLAAKESANAKLTALGLTAEEIAAITK